MSKLLTEEQASHYLGVDVDQLRLRREQNFPPPYYTLGSQIRYRAEDLDRFVEESEELWQRHEPGRALPEPAPDVNPASVAVEPQKNPLPVENVSVPDAEELAARQRLAQAVADTPTGPSLPRKDSVFSRPVGTIRTDEGGEIEAADPYSGFSPEEMGGVGFPPDTT